MPDPEPGAVVIKREIASGRERYAILLKIGSAKLNRDRTPLFGRLTVPQELLAVEPNIQVVTSCRPE